MGADYSFYMKTIETHARAFFKIIIFSIGSVTGSLAPTDFSGAIFTCAQKNQKYLTHANFLSFLQNYSLQKSVKFEISFWCLQFSQKTNLKTQIFAIAYWGRNFFVGFLGVLKKPKCPFEIN